MAYARLSTRDTSGLHPNLRGYLGFMGDDGNSPITIQDAMTQAIDGHNSPDFADPSWMAYFQSDVQNMQIVFNDPLCAGVPQASSLGIVKVAGGLALQDTNAIANTAMATGSAVAGGVVASIPIIGAIFSTIMAIWGMFTAHHQAAVRQENQLACALVPAANNFFVAISAAVGNGTVSPSDAADALDALPAPFKSQASPSWQDNPCNAMCEYSVVVEAICRYWSAQYRTMAAQMAANAQDYAAQNNPSTPASSLTSPTVAPAAASDTSAATAQIAQLQAQVAQLQQQATAAQANGDVATASALTTQATTLTQQAAKIQATLPTSSFSLKSIPTWAWIGAGVFLAWKVL